MKIAIFCPNYPPAVSEGGISHYTRCLARHLCEAGDDVYIIAGKEYCGSGEDDKIRVFKYAGPWNLGTLRLMAQQLSIHNIDLINLQYSPVMYSPQFKIGWNYLAKRFVSTVSFHTLWGGSWLNKLVAVNFMLTANGGIATNSEIIYLLKRYFPIFLKNTCHIPIGSNIKLMPSGINGQKIIEAKYSIDPNVPILSFFGMSYPGKGLEMLLRTAKILIERHKVVFKLLVIGGGESDVFEYIQENMELARALGIQDNVVFTGEIPVEEVSALFNSSSAIILPFTSGVSDRRGSLMAALAHNKAIITTKPAIPIDSFKNRKNMVWPRESSAECLAEVTMHVLQDTSFRRTLENGAKKLALQYRWEDIAENTAQFFQTMILNNKSSKTAPTV